MGACERIKGTPFPPVYNTLIRVAIWVFAIVFPSTVSLTVGYWAILFGWLLAVIFVLTYRAGQALMEPFGMDHSATAMSLITRTIEINLLEQLGEKDIPKPVEPIKDTYVL